VSSPDEFLVVKLRPWTFSDSEWPTTRIFLRHSPHVQVFRDTVWVWAVSTAAVAVAGEDRSEIFERHGGDRETVSLHPLRPSMPRKTPQQRHLQPRLESGTALSRRSFDDHSCSLVTFHVSRRRRETYCGHARLCVCLSVCPRPHAYTITRTRM